MLSRPRALLTVGRVAAAAMLPMFGCSDHDLMTSSDVEHITRAPSKLIGGLDVTSSEALPEAAVGSLTGPTEYGTATIIQRQGRNGGAVLLTAAHALCDYPQQLVGPNVGAAMFTHKKFTDINTNAVGWKFGDSCSDNASIGVSDIAIVELTNPVSIADFPVLPRVYTGADFRDRFINFKDPLTPFFGYPVLATSARELPLITQAQYDTIELKDDYALASIFGNFRVT